MLSVRQTPSPMKIGVRALLQGPCALKAAAALSAA